MRLSAQCYTVRDHIAADLWGTLASMRDIGLRYVEIGGTFGVPVDEFKQGLDRLDLKVNANHKSLGDLQDNLGAVIEECRTLAIPCVVLSSVGREQYEKGWAAVARTIEPIGAKLRAAGILFAYHNHAFEFQAENGRPGLDILYENADTRLVTAQIDTYWVAYGGADPAAYLRKLTGRVKHCHLKDGRLGGSEPHFLEIGQGDLDWDDILAACGEAGVEFGAIEQDTCDRNTLESLRISVDFLRAKGLT